ncbi:hypothetical protein CRG98_032943 [Punica granatum]|uniref:RNase H type-1 domain-containing protein n=1 Tax=Punica granatum TaxID=22663 RepID=A0A2I0IRH7_PUNGR|nr:hypothetical protein CRG98_032943 [Punica granatum]
MLKNLISPFQGSFIKGRRAADNVIILREIVQSFRTRSGNIEGFILKLDSEKAYDGLEWGFLRKVLHYFGFPDDWVGLIKSCISTTSMSIMFNGGCPETFSPSRGRAVLINSITTTIPSYVMQCTHLPKEVNRRLDKINRHFLWGSTSEKKKLYLVNWSMVTRPNDQGGLGNRDVWKKGIRPSWVDLSSDLQRMTPPRPNFKPYLIGLRFGTLKRFLGSKYSSGYAVQIGLPRLLYFMVEECRVNLCVRYARGHPRLWNISVVIAQMPSPSRAASRCRKNFKDHQSATLLEIPSFQLLRLTSRLSWSPLPPGYYKLNTDGSCCGNPGKAGAGGLIRDEAGNWAIGFSMNLRITTSFVAELVALRQGLLLAKSQGTQKLFIEIDATLIYEWIWGYGLNL